MTPRPLCPARCWSAGYPTVGAALALAIAVACPSPARGDATLPAGTGEAPAPRPSPPPRPPKLGGHVHVVSPPAAPKHALLLHPHGPGEPCFEVPS